MKKYLLGIVFPILLCCCTNQGKQDSHILGGYKKEQKFKDYSQLIKLTSVSAGWGSIVDYDGMGMPEIKITLQNISTAPITDDLYLKYRFIEGEEIIGESIQTIHYNTQDIPWGVNLKKNITLSLGSYIPDARKRNLNAQIYDENNELLWEGKIENKILK